MKITKKELLTIISESSNQPQKLIQDLKQICKKYEMSLNVKQIHEALMIIADMYEE